MIVILLAIPYGVCLQRDRLDVYIAYILTLVGFLAVMSVVAPNATMRAFSKVNLLEWVISIIQTVFGASIGFVVSALIKKVWK